MTDPLGLAWLAGYDSLSIGLVFVRGLSPQGVFRAFGADPALAVERGPDEPYDQERDGPFAGPTVRVGQAGDWLVAVEEHLRPYQAARHEVLRRASAGGEAVAVSTDIGKGNHTYGYAVAGDVVATLMTSMPLSWGGSDPGRLEPLARELGLAGDGGEPPDDMGPLEAMLTLAERAHGLSIDPDDVNRPLLCAPVVPVPDDLPRPVPPPAGQQHRTGDPVLDLLLNRAAPEALAAAAVTRLRRLITATGLDAHPELAGAVEAALSGHPGPVQDDDPAGLVLRRLALDQELARDQLNDQRTPGGGWRPGAPLADLRARIRRGDAARLLGFLFHGRSPAQLLAGELQRQQSWDSQGFQEPLSWRDQAIADLGGTAPSGDPAADAALRAAEAAWLAEPEAVRSRPGVIGTEPVRAHVAALIAAGMDPERIAGLGGCSPFFIDSLLHGRVRLLHSAHARRLLVIPVPEAPAP